VRSAIAHEAQKFSDDAYRTMFLKEHKMYEVMLNEKGENILGPDGKPLLRELSEQEKLNLKPGAGGKVRVSANGIFTDEAAASYFAAQHAGKNGGPLYIVAFPKADKALGELMVAGYQKFLEGDALGLTNSAEELKKLGLRYGRDGLELYGHSRGSMTIGNAMKSIEHDGANGQLNNTDIRLFGPAYKAQKAADSLYRLSNGRKKSVSLENHKDDFVGSVIGGNPATNTKIPDGSSHIKERVNMLKGGDKNGRSVHNCYGGDAPGECTDRYGPSNRIEIKSRYAK